MNRKVWMALCAAAGAVMAGPPAVWAPVTVYAQEPVLHLGDHGPAVVDLQKALKAAGYYSGAVDGSFGAATLNAVKSFQKANGLPADGVVGTGTWSALTSRKFQPMQILLNGQVISTPSGFAWQGTTYMPIWYLQQALTKLGILSTWDGTHWNLQVPASMHADLSNIQIGTGAQVLEINGTPVKRVNGIASKDPAGDSMTTYMPIWYLMGLLDRLGVQHSWDGSHWNMTTQQSYYAYTADGNVVGGPYSSLDAAKAAIAGIPGGVIKDGTGSVVFTQAGFAAYTSPAQDPVVLPTLDAAKQRISGASTGFVVDLATHKVVQFPQNYYYLNSNGSFVSTVYGWIGAAPPSFAKPGERYIALDVNPGHSPHLSQFYLLSQSDGTYVGKLLGTYENPFRTVDLRFPAPAGVTAEVIDQWFAANGSPLQGLGDSFIRAQQRYGVDAAYLAAHAVLETGWGKSAIMQAKNNLFGYGAYDADPAHAAGTFPSADYSIQFAAWFVRNGYLDADGQHFYQWPTLDGMNEHYATDPAWSQKIATLMAGLSQSAQVAPGSFPQYVAGQSAPAPQSSDEPVFRMPGALGVVQANPYGNLPVWSDPSDGADQMFPGDLKLGDGGNGVKLLQQALNRASGAGLQTDGAFGPLTQSALITYQQAHGLPATGVCDIRTWQSLIPTPAQSIPQGVQVTVDQAREGMVGNLPSEWYHVTAGGVSGWVDSAYIALINVYRAMSNGSSMVNLYSAPSRSAQVLAKVHSGDWLVCSNPTPAGGFIAVQFVDQNQPSASPVTAYVDASAAQLVALPAPTGN
ncbi:MAG: peptidoglycan-binding protein [Alicyclobacillus macrosporangiidus]|uniref:peptidoglycan-binding protein n=1 Tax=Alicyclobacillus macrosporangiidus TaxID=392015 RepID=UPI0026F2C403|nr:peptidoglycan-binding protein [Alicyclobacillus macrosporangiidus]MCL6598095.1 peptidoglycan-binding protein [Alicyclobacillus macrosporangiidus]